MKPMASDLENADHAAEHYAQTGSTVCWCDFPECERRRPKDESPVKLEDGRWIGGVAMTWPSYSTITAHTNGDCGPGCPCCEYEDERTEALMARALEDARPTLERIIDQLEWWEGANPGHGSYLDAARELRAVIRGEEA